MYKYSDVKRNFGANGKILPNLSDYFSQNDFLERIQFSFELFEKFEIKKEKWFSWWDKIKYSTTSRHEERNNKQIYKIPFLKKWKQDEFYNRFGEIFKDIIGISLFDKFNLF